MQQIKDMEFSGERPLFASHDLQLDNVVIHAGESALKECSNIIAIGCRFEVNIRSGTWMASPSRIACLPKVDVLRYGTPKI